CRSHPLRSGRCPRRSPAAIGTGNASTNRTRRRPLRRRQQRRARPEASARVPTFLLKSAPASCCVPLPAQGHVSPLWGNQRARPQPALLSGIFCFLDPSRLLRVAVTLLISTICT